MQDVSIWWPWLGFSRRWLKMVLPQFLRPRNVAAGGADCRIRDRASTLLVREHVGQERARSASATTFGPERACSCRSSSVTVGYNCSSLQKTPTLPSTLSLQLSPVGRPQASCRPRPRAHGQLLANPNPFVDSGFAGPRQEASSKHVHRMEAPSLGEHGFRHP